MKKIPLTLVSYAHTTLFSLAIMLCSCGGGGSIDLTTENAPLAEPIQYYGNYYVALDENNQLWEWSVDGRTGEIQPKTLNKIDIANVYSFTLAPKINAALDNNGKVWTWTKHKPETIQQQTYLDTLPSPIVKMRYLSPTQSVFLLSDGTMRGYDMARVNYAAFKDIVDFENATFDIGAIDRHGDFYLTKGKSIPSKIEGVKNIERVFYNTRKFYLIDNQDTLYVVGGGSNIEKLEDVPIRTVLGLHQGSMRVADRNGNNYRVAVGYADRQGRGGIKFRTRDDLDLTPRKGFGAWRTKKGMIVLELDGSLNHYDYIRSGKRSFKDSKIENPRRIGDFKIKMDYFKK